MPASRLVDRVLDTYQVRQDPREAAVVQDWASIVGERIAARAWPHHIRDGVLVVAVSNASWLSQLGHARLDLQRQINAAVGGGGSSASALLREVRFELASRLRRPADTDAIRRPPPPRPRQPPAPASGQHLASIEADASRVEDPELREAILSTRTRWNR